MIPYKPKIFISSTIYDMPNERVAALKAVEAVAGEPIMSEYSINAQNADSVTTCLNKVRECDLYILIVGGRYGWRPFDKESITELEYITAQQNNKPTLVFNMTQYSKEELQDAFSKRVGATYFWKSIADAFALKDEVVKAMQEEFDKWEKGASEKTELIYSNLLNISFPDRLFVADLDLDREQIIADSKNSEKWLKKSASWFEVAVWAIHQRNIRFPHDWIIHNKQLITFHDLTDHSIPLSKIIDLGTVTELRPSEFYEQNDEAMKSFKFLLKQCLEAKLFKLKIQWFKKSKLFAFVPTLQDANEHWLNREIEWTKKKKATRTVVKVTYGRKDDPDLMTSARHLAFAAKFHVFDEKWFVAIKPDWLVTWKRFLESRVGFEKVQYIKKQERNGHVFNHLNFILRYLQPSATGQLFDEYRDYPFLRIESFTTFNHWPIIPDETWRELEGSAAKKGLMDTEGKIDLYNGH